MNRSSEIEIILNNGINEGSAVLLTGETSDNFVQDGHLISLPSLISKFGAKKNMPALRFSLEKHVVWLQAPGVPEAGTIPRYTPRRPATEVFDDVFRTLDSDNPTPQPTIFIIDFAEALILDNANPRPEEDRIRQQILHRVYDPVFMKKKHLLVLISRVRPLDSAFTQMPGIIRYNISLPKQPERLSALEIMTASNTAPLILADDLPPERLARMSGGINLDAMSRMRHQTNNDNPLTRETVLALKKELINKQSGGTLTIHDEERDINSDIAGLAQLKLFIKNTKDEGVSTVRLLLLGPPGTGKTLCATAVARELDTIPVSLAQVKSMWVGESERHFRRAIEILESNAPVTLILDECDQLAMGSRSGPSAALDSSSVDTSLRGMLLEWLGDVGANNGISIIAMSNNAEGVDPAFRDRLVTVPILEACSPADKARIAMIQLKRMGIAGDEDGIAKAFAESTRSFTGRQIVKMLGKSARLAKQNSGGVVGYTEMKASIGGMLRSFDKREQLMSLMAVRFTDDIDYLPWAAAKTMGDQTVGIPEYIRPYFSEDGMKCDEEKLEAYINKNR